MFLADKSDFTLTETKQGLIGFASDLALSPGEWPGMIAVTDEHGAGFLFLRERVTDEAGTYSTRNGEFSLTLFND